MDVKCLVDTGAIFLMLPERIATQLNLKTAMKKEAIIAEDGTSRIVPYAGPMQIKFKNRVCFVGALIMGDEVCLARYRYMDLVVIPKLLKLDVNPKSPNLRGDM